MGTNNLSPVPLEAYWKEGKDREISLVHLLKDISTYKSLPLKATVQGLSTSCNYSNISQTQPNIPSTNNTGYLNPPNSPHQDNIGRSNSSNHLTNSSKEASSNSNQNEIYSYLIEGPNEDLGEERVDNLVCGRTISTYPVRYGTREGDPVCDRFCAQVFCNESKTQLERVLFSIADGCNWGSKPKKAAIRATNGFMCHMRKHHTSIQSVKDAAQLLLSSLERAASDIYLDLPDPTEGGTTTLLGGMLIPVKYKDKDKDKDKDREKEKDYACCSNAKFLLLCINIGDCKAFHWSRKTGQLTDLTAGNRQNINNPRDPGGRLGPYLKDGLPDLRNLNFYYKFCDIEDLVILMSDGVHDNLDCIHLGKEPKDFQFGEDLSWKQIEKDHPKQLEEIKAQFASRLLRNLITEPSEQDYHGQHNLDHDDFDPERMAPAPTNTSSQPRPSQDRSRMSRSTGDESNLTTSFDSSPPRPSSYSLSPSPNNISPPTSPLRLSASSVGGGDSFSQIPDVRASLPVAISSHPSSYHPSSSTGASYSPPALHSNPSSAESPPISYIQYLPSPTSVTRSLLRHCEQITESCRSFLQNNPSSKEPSSFTQYPGKMDHTTCLTFVVYHPPGLHLYPNSPPPGASSSFHKRISLKVFQSGFSRSWSKLPLVPRSPRLSRSNVSMSVSEASRSSVGGEKVAEKGGEKAEQQRPRLSERDRRRHASFHSTTASSKARGTRSLSPLRNDITDNFRASISSHDHHRSNYYQGGQANNSNRSSFVSTIMTTNPASSSLSSSSLDDQTSSTSIAPRVISSSLETASSAQSGDPNSFSTSSPSTPPSPTPTSSPSRSPIHVFRSRTGSITNDPSQHPSSHSLLVPPLTQIDRLSNNGYVCVNTTSTPNIYLPSSSSSPTSSRPSTTIMPSPSANSIMGTPKSSTTSGLITTSSSSPYVGAGLVVGGGLTLGGGGGSSSASSPMQSPPSSPPPTSSPSSPSKSALALHFYKGRMFQRNRGSSSVSLANSISISLSPPPSTSSTSVAYTPTTSSPSLSSSTTSPFSVMVPQSPKRERSLTHSADVHQNSQESPHKPVKGRQKSSKSRHKEKNNTSNHKNPSESNNSHNQGHSLKHEGGTETEDETQRATSESSQENLEDELVKSFSAPSPDSGLLSYSLLQ